MTTIDGKLDISKSKKSKQSRDSGSHTYTCLRDLFKRKLKDLGYNPDEFGLLSLRAGGAMAAANNGVPGHLFKRHGRWKPDGAKDGYVEGSAEHRLGSLCHFCYNNIKIVL